METALSEIGAQCFAFEPNQSAKLDTAGLIAESSAGMTLALEGSFQERLMVGPYQSLTIKIRASVHYLRVSPSGSCPLPLSDPFQCFPNLSEIYG